MNNEDGLDIEIDSQVANGVYSNFVVIAHTPSDFVVDFLSIMPGVPKPQVRSRVILTPDNAKRLLETLQENIDSYEEENGEIILDKNQSQDTDMIIRGGKA